MKDMKRKDMTPDQAECFDLLCALMRGEHHVNHVSPFGRGIKTWLYSGQLATFDFDYLTRLVILCHDRCIRAEIIQSGPGRIGVALHKRHAREGCIAERHPTIAEAVAQHSRATP